MSGPGVIIATTTATTYTASKCPFITLPSPEYHASLEYARIRRRHRPGEPRAANARRRRGNLPGTSQAPGPDGIGSSGVEAGDRGGCVTRYPSGGSGELRTAAYRPRRVQPAADADRARLCLTRRADLGGVACRAGDRQAARAG